MRDKNLSDQGHNSYIYQMCKRAPLPTYMRNENVIDKQALEWCSLGMQVGRQVGRSFLVRSCLLITLIKCLIGHKSMGLLLKVVLYWKLTERQVGSQVGRQVCRYVGMQVGRSFLVRSCLLVTLIKCPKGHKCVGSLCRLVKTLIISSVTQTDKVTY